MTATEARGAGRAWLVAGVLLLIYCVAGNWIALPGYRRFLAHESSGAGGLAFVWGATRTIAWMLSFHVGALCVAYAVLKARGEPLKRFRRGFLAAGLLWIVVWAIPILPGPYTAFFAGTGIVIMAAIVTAFVRAWTAGRDGAVFAAAGEPLRIVSYFFFALATWDICGLGSVGGILDPDGAHRAASQALVVAQTTKLIVELALAWILLAVAALPARRS